MNDITKILEERDSTYGKFENHAHISQGLKTVMKRTPKWDSLDEDMVESLEMIVHKIARILNGNPSYIDSWTDIAGYSQLVANRLSAQCTKD